MTAGLDVRPPAVELLDRALGYTGSALSTVASDPRSWWVRTPCRDWDLAALLHHMDDALDAFLEAAAGEVHLPTARNADSHATIDVIRLKACTLVASWGGDGTDRVRIGDVELDRALLARTAALEITLHGWDVAQATGHPTPVPPDLASALLPVALQVIAPAERGLRFDPPVPVPDDAGVADRLLAYSGRHPTWPI